MAAGVTTTDSTGAEASFGPGIMSRRALLAGGAGAAVLAIAGLSGCGGDEASSKDGDGGSAATDAAGASTFSLLSFIDAASTLVPGTEQRAVFGVGDDRGALVRDSPPRLTFSLRDLDGAEVDDPVEVDRHAEGLPRAYYPVPVTLPGAGTYEVVTTIDDSTVRAAFQVSEPGSVEIPGPGDPAPEVATPTTADPRGVDPICTQDPPCPLHETTLTDLLGQTPVALLIGTPAYCQTAICGPVLDVLTEVAPDYEGRVAFIHAEVYQNGAEVEANGTTATQTEMVKAMKLPFEPTLVLIQGDATIARRLDVIYDRTELIAALDGLVA